MTLSVNRKLTVVPSAMRSLRKEKLLNVNIISAKIALTSGCQGRTPVRFAGDKFEYSVNDINFFNL